MLDRDDNTAASPEDFKEVMAEPKKKTVQFLFEQEDNELSDAVNIGFARFMTHFEDKTVKTLSTVKPKKPNKQTNQNKVLSSVLRSLQLVKNQGGGRRG